MRQIQYDNFNLKNIGMSVGHRYRPIKKTIQLCRRCNMPISFNNKKRGYLGKQIPLDTNGNPHSCTFPESKSLRRWQESSMDVLRISIHQ